MSSFAVKVERIAAVENHPNADRLDIVQVLGWNCVVTKGKFKAGDLCVYFPIDSVLPAEVETAIFGIDSKIKLEKSRIRTIKLRGAISQGLAVGIEELRGVGSNWGDGFQDFHLGDDLTKPLGVTKYEPPVSATLNVSHQTASKKQTNPNFRRYTEIENIKNYPNVFEEGEEVVVTCKIHGSSFRAGYVPYVADTWWKKLLQKLNLLPKYQFVYGSHNVQLQDKLLVKTFYEKNVYAEAVKKYDLMQSTAFKSDIFPWRKVPSPLGIPDGVVLYGEVYGDGIQKGYTYGCVPGERRLVLFDIMVDGKYLSFPEFEAMAAAHYWPTVLVLYRGPYSKEKVLELATGPSVLDPSQKVREGCVVKPLKEQTTYMGRKVLKVINPEYLLNKDNSEHH